MKGIKKTIFILFFIYLGIFLFIPNNALAARPTLTPLGGTWGSPTPLTSGTIGSPYSDTITASGCGGSGSYNWAYGGSLPPGLSLSAGGSRNSILTISGTPTSTGTYKVAFRACNRGCNPRCSAWWQDGWYSITITAPLTLNITTTSLPDGVTGVAYSSTITAEGGTTPYSWAVTAGTLPPGLTLSPTGTPSTTLSGTPTTAGTYTFTITVTDSALNTDTQQYTVNISDLQIITMSPLPNGAEGISYSTTITGSGGSGSYTWSVSDGLPPGLTLASTGTPSTTLSGIPTAFGTYTFTITLTDGTNIATKDFTLVIDPSDLSIDTTTLSPDTATVCVTYSASITASGGNPPYNWTITSGTLPPGLAISASGTPPTGSPTTISGTPTASGTYSFEVTVTDSTSVSRTEVYGITVTGSASCVPTIDDYTAYPPFVQLSSVKPNVLLVVDNSGSMYEFAYKTPGKGGSISNPDDSYVPGQDYYGYFESTSNYSYETTGGGYFYADAAGTWDGNFLNWLTMRRVDIIRKVLVGGKANPRSQTQINYLIAAENPDRNFWKEYNFQKYRVYGGSSYEQIRVCSNSSCSSGSTYNVRIKYSDTPQEPQGLLHENIDKMRFGLMFFNRGNKYEQGGSGKDGGYLALKIGTDATSLITQIENTDPTTWTPLGETMYEAIRFFQATFSAYNGGTYNGKDPLAEYCQDNFVLIMTDGESTMDRNIPGGNWGSTVTDSNFNVCNYMDSIGLNEGYSSQCAVSANSSGGTYYLEGTSYYAHINDLRPDPVGKCPDANGVYDIECGMQYISTYTVFAFDESPVGRELLQKTAKYGGFNDYDGDGVPYTNSTCGTATPDAYCSEWDRDGDGVPDTYYEAQEGSELEQQIRAALEDILRKMSSGTSASVLATTGEGEGAVYQAYFIPSRIEGANEVTWTGYLHGLLVDEFGNLREDTYGNKRLCYDAGNPVSSCTGPNDIVTMFYDEVVHRTRVKRYSPGTIDSDGTPTATPTIIEFNDMNVLWEAGSVLWSRNISLNPRVIKTTTDGTSMIDFSVLNRAVLKPYLGVSSDDEAEAVIRFISGEDDPTVNSVTYDYRPRTITIGGTSNVWKLGDITYSTPMTVAKPAEYYSLLYQDQTYTTFRGKYKYRRHVTYTGANDGMLHAFNAGFYDPATLKFWKDYDINTGSFSDMSGYELGEELWAFIPQSLLPHLKWLTDNNYTHVYYVDLKPKVVDARIFTEESECSTDVTDPACVHPYGWGTVLIGGMRYGGRDITFQDASWATQRTFRSAYFALDITDPLNPDLLWTIPITSDTNTAGTPDLGLTISRPAVLRVVNDNPGTWYAVFGSGPDADSDLNGNGINDSYDGISERAANIYVVDLATGALLRTFSDASLMDYSFMADPITVDANLTDKIVDVIYVGNTYCQSGSTCTSSNWKGKMFRISTNAGDSNTANWTLSTLYDPMQPITSAPAASLDNLGNLWVYFGTGRYLSVNDNTLDGTESWSFYGIKDKCQPWSNPSCTTTMIKSDLFDASNVAVYTDESVTGAPGIGNFDELEASIDLPTNDGWYLDFPTAGERSLFKPGIVGGLAVWTTYTPDTADVCALAGNSKLYATYYKTGTAYKKDVIGTDTGTGEIFRTVDLGKGVPSAVGFTVSGEKSTMAYIQQSTGVIFQLEQTTPFTLKSNISGWRTDCQ